jgi:hypothetical protein
MVYDERFPGPLLPQFSSHPLKILHHHGRHDGVSNFAKFLLEDTDQYWAGGFLVEYEPTRPTYSPKAFYSQKGK